jgi:N-acetylglucosaminyldiphosphoundecaprenol N-acetyl-beta-D-mannosaminyltransferase
MGCQIDNLNFQETVDTIADFIKQGIPKQHVVVNVDKLVKASRNPQLQAIINDCALINADGMPVVWAAKLLGKPLKERVAGIDLFVRLIAEAEIRNWRVFLLGAKQEVLQQTMEIFKQKHPNITICGSHHGYWQPAEENKIINQIQSSQADILFVAMSSPKKEIFVAKHLNHLQVPFVMGVGGSFDVIAGLTKRAPVWMQKFGLEWFFRFLQEPRRMFKRYFIDDSRFFTLFFKEWLNNKHQ